MDMRTPALRPALAGVVMGSASDWDTMRHACTLLDEFGIPYEARVLSAHRMPDEMFAFADAAHHAGFRAIIAGAGGAAHLPGMTAAKSALPVLGVPVQSRSLNGVDSLLSLVQRPAGIPVGTLAIGRAGAINAGLLAAAILANKYPAIGTRLAAYRAAQTERVLADPDPRASQS